MASMAKSKIAIAALILASNVSAADILGADVQGWIGGETVTNGRDAVQIGVTFEWKHVEVDVSHGVQKVHYRVPAEPEWEMDKWQGGTIGVLRIYPFNTQTIRPLLVWSHASDITRGKPFNDKEEPTSDFFGAGVTVEVKRFELDIAYGSLGRECRILECYPGSRTNELRIGFRGYFWK